MSEAKANIFKDRLEIATSVVLIALLCQLESMVSGTFRMNISDSKGR